MLKMAHIPAVALLGLAVLSTPAAARAAQETERVDRTVQISAGGQLRLKNFSGHVTINAVRRASRDRLDHIKLEIRETGSGISIDLYYKDTDTTEKDNNVVET